MSDMMNREIISEGITSSIIEKEPQIVGFIERKEERGRSV